MWKKEREQSWLRRYSLVLPLLWPILCFVQQQLFKMGLFCAPCLESLVVFVTIVCLVAKPHNDVIAHGTVHGPRASWVLMCLLVLLYVVWQSLAVMPKHMVLCTVPELRESSCVVCYWHMLCGIALLWCLSTWFCSRTQSGSESSCIFSIPQECYHH